ncbi:hypothetical protein ABZ714_19420 [Streptomyces sp. NPDC006798]|uniref:hypothetical protein n=1 Tax=Streptomyces sp. NPDC006798 TaxID=3155462 RepID=UPI0033D5F2A3
MWTTLIAVIGTLSGVALASTTQIWADRRARTHQHRQDVAAAAAALLDAVLSYREIYWLRVDSIRGGEADPVDRAAVYRARSEVTRARDRLALATADPALIAAAEEAAWSAIDLSDVRLGAPSSGRFAAEVEEALDRGRERTRDAHTALRVAVTEYVHGQ